MNACKKFRLSAELFLHFLRYPYWNRRNRLASLRQPA
jgi:hypothetical protein